MASRKLIVEIVGDTRSLDRAFQKSGRAADGFGHKMKRIGLGLGAVAIAGAGLGIALGVKAVKAASDLGEQVNKINVVFRKGAKHVEAWARTTASSIGISDEKALEFAGTFGNMLVPMGIARSKAAKMSTTLVQLAADMASFNNVSPEEALVAIQSGLANQVRPLRRMGVFLDQDRIKMEAFSLGLVKADVDMAKVGMKRIALEKAIQDQHKARAKFGASSFEARSATAKVAYAQDALTKAMAGSIPKLTTAQKTMAAYSLILKDTQDTQGDFRRTLGKSLPNAMRVLRAQLTDLMGAFGKGLIPVVMRAAQMLRKRLADPNVRAYLQRLGFIIGTKLLNAFIAISQWFRQNWPSILKFIKQAVKDIQKLANALSRIGHFLGKFGFVSKTLNIGSTDLEKQAIVNAWQKATPQQRAAFLKSGQAVNVNGDVHVHGVEDPKKLTEAITRHAKKKTQQTRGRVHSHPPPYSR